MKGGNGYETFQKGISDAGGFVHVGWMRDDRTGGKRTKFRGRQLRIYQFL